MKILIIQGGMRKHGTSAMLAQSAYHVVKETQESEIIHVLDYVNRYEEVILKMEEADHILFSMPCYVNTLPYLDMLFLQNLNSITFSKDKYCAILMQGGMPYPQVHQNGADVIKLFAQSKGWNYYGSLIIGIGPVLNGKELKRIPWYGKRIRVNLQAFLIGFLKDKPLDSCIQEHMNLKVPLWVYRLLSVIMNHKLKKEMKIWGYDPFAPCPYKRLEDTLTDH